jgi:5,6,7,8-tetrahydromethanopterin hydro-lyase
VQEQGRSAQIGESFVGDGAEVAHVNVNTVLADRDGPVGPAWATVLAMPTPERAAFAAALRPNLLIRPACPRS